MKQLQEVLRTADKAQKQCGSETTRGSYLLDGESEQDGGE